MKIEESKGKVLLTKEDERLEFASLRPGIVRVTYSREEIREVPSLFVSAEETESAPILIREEEGETILAFGNLRARVRKADLTVTWEKENRGILLSEGEKEFSKVPVMRFSTEGEEPVIRRVKTVDGERNFIENLKEVKDHDAWRGRLYFHFQKDEAIHGFGQGEDGIYDYRNFVQYLYQHNMRIPMPTFVSTKGYGMLFDCASLMTFHDGKDGSWIHFDAIPQFTYYFIAADSVDEIIAGFRALTGKAAMLPKWAFGFVQSKEQYYTARELVEVAKHYRDLNLPLDCVVQDWNTWEEGKWGNKILDPKRYGDMKECAKELTALHVHSMISVWPNMNSGTENYEELLAAGKLLNDLATYDAFDEEARAIYWKQVKEGLFDQGFESLWCDSTEPFSGPDWGGEIKREPEERFSLVGGEHKKYLPAEQANAYALMHAKGIFENQRKDIKDRRVLNLTRSGYLSGQKYAAVLWSGDQTASWETLRCQITEGLNMGLSGYPWWTLDIGGFFTVGKEWQRRGCSCNTDPTPKWFWKGKYDLGVEDKGYRELYVRWFEFGTFLPMFRSHGTDTPREIWNFGKKGEPFYDAIEKFMRLRYRLMPTIYSMAGSVRLYDETMMRSLLFDFPEDPKAAEESTQFMFGHSMMICPVTEPVYYEAGNVALKKERSRRCYLPDGASWVDFWNGTRYKGGQTVRAAIPIDRIPIFIRTGSILMERKGLTYAAEENDEPLQLHIYSGDNASFIYYDDAGDDYGYENGEYETIAFYWNDRTRKLKIGERKGSFPGMKRDRRFEIYLDGNFCFEMMYHGEERELDL